MKIYNKRTFAAGILAAALGLLNGAAGFRKGFDAESLMITLFLLFFGGGSLIRSFSRKWSREDQVDALDERNRLIGLKSKSKAFQLTQGIVFCGMTAFLIIGKVYGYEMLISIGVGLGFAFSVSMLTELFTYFHYEKHS